MLLISYILKITPNDFHKFFEVFIQLGAILAVIVNYFNFLLNNKYLIKKIIISFIPTAFIGVIFYKIIKNIFFESELLIILMLIFVGFLFILIELVIKKGKIKLENKLENLNYLQAFLIGLFQSLSIIPGVSRAGAVILSMLFLKFRREDSVLYSFFLAVPIIISAGFYDLYKSGYTQILSNFQNLFYLLIGFITSFVFAFFTIKWFIDYLQKNNLTIFGYYRIVLGLIFLIYLYFL